MARFILIDYYYFYCYCNCYYHCFLYLLHIFSIVTNSLFIHHPSSLGDSGTQGTVWSTLWACAMVPAVLGRGKSQCHAVWPRKCHTRVRWGDWKRGYFLISLSTYTHIYINTYIYIIHIYNDLWCVYIYILYTYVTYEYVWMHLDWPNETTPGILLTRVLFFSLVGWLHGCFVHWFSWFGLVGWSVRLSRLYIYI